jgi:hypothetical protein
MGFNFFYQATLLPALSDERIRPLSVRVLVHLIFNL